MSSAVAGSLPDGNAPAPSKSPGAVDSLAIQFAQDIIRVVDDIGVVDDSAGQRIGADAAINPVVPGTD